MTERVLDGTLRLTESGEYEVVASDGRRVPVSPPPEWLGCRVRVWRESRWVGVAVMREGEE